MFITGKHSILTTNQQKDKDEEPQDDAPVGLAGGLQQVHPLLFCIWRVYLLAKERQDCVPRPL